jgi:hypothetical protein
MQISIEKGGALWPHRLARSRTSAFEAGNPSSNLGEATTSLFSVQVSSEKDEGVREIL